MSSGLSGVEQRSLKKGQFVFREHETGETAFLVSEGEVEILKIIDGKEVVLGRVGKSGMFGEMALISNKPRMASARVSRDAKLMVIQANLFENKLKALDPFSRALIHVLSDHTRSIAGKLDTDMWIS